MPILDHNQASILEGVGDNVSKKFFHFIKQRQEEFDKVQEGLKEEEKYLNLNQKIIAEDHKLNSNENNKPSFMKKRKVDEIENDDTDTNQKSKADKRKKPMQGFLDIGSSSWSMFLA